MDTITRTGSDVRHEYLRIAGKKVETKARLEVRFPWDNRLVGTVPRATPELVAEAFQIAHDYKPKLTRYQRQQILLKTAELLVARKEELSRLITLESGLCLRTRSTRSAAPTTCSPSRASSAMLDDGQTFSCDLTPHGKSRKIFTLRQPLNAISAITPFNHPLNMVAHKLAPAFATNNCVVLKPTELTPLTALFLADTLYEAGLPPEMLSVITGNPSDIGDAMIVDPRADLVTFTGSVRVGKYIAEKAGYKRIVLELGGNDPLIVMEDADLDKAAELAVAGATKNSGQRCTAVKRILVVDKVADAFVEQVLAKAKKLKRRRSAGSRDRCRHGDPRARRHAVRATASARPSPSTARKLLHGNDRQGALFPPTVVDHVDPQCRAGARGDVRARDPDHPREGHRPRDPGLQLDRLRPVVGRLHRSARLHHQRSSPSSGRHGEHLGSAGLSHRDVAVRRHQGFRPRLQGRRAGGDEELHQREDLVAALAGLGIRR